MLAVVGIPPLATHLRGLSAALAASHHSGALARAERKRIAADIAAIAETLDLLGALLRELGGETPPAGLPPLLRAVPTEAA